MLNQQHTCPDCDSADVSLEQSLDRRRFLKTTGAAALVAGSSPLWAQAKDTAAAAKSRGAETLVKTLYETLSADQKKEICFDWDYQDTKRGLLRTRISNNWHITKPAVGSSFYTKDQQAIIRDIFESMYSPAWVEKIDKQLKDDAGGYGRRQNIAIFGQPGEGKFELVMTGRHLTIRCDGDSAEHMAFGGPIFYGHAADGFNEGPEHPGNVFWPQAQEANKLYQMLDGKQQKLALVTKNTPDESRVGFQGQDGDFWGIPVTEMSADQKEHLQKVLALLIEPYRKSDQEEALACLKTQGGLDACHLAFFSENDIGDDGVWDVWRLEGPSFVWHFRGEPHVHVWVNVSSSPAVELNAEDS